MVFLKRLGNALYLYCTLCFTLNRCSTKHGWHISLNNPYNRISILCTLDSNTF